MSRSKEDIVESMQTEIGYVDPTIDVSKGPIYESALVPWATELANTESAVEHLSSLYQLDNARLWTDDEIEELGRKYGMEFGQGAFSQGFLTFYCNDRPQKDIALPVGTLAATDGSEFIFQTIEEVYIYADTADAYYNASTRRYEIKVAAQAIQPGTSYDVSKGRIRVLLSAISGISGVINEDKFYGGVVEQSLEDFIDVLQELPLGNALGTPGGLASLLLRTQAASINALSVVTPADTTVFERLTETGLRQEIDIYVIGQKIGFDQYTYITVGAETEIVLPKPPVLSVTSVLVDGSAVNYSLSPDTTAATRGTLSAQDKVILETSPGSGKEVYVSYTYNKLITDLQDQMDKVRSALFKTQTVVREGKKVTTVVDVSLPRGFVQIDDVEDLILNFFKDPSMVGRKQQFIGEASPTQFGLVLSNNLGVMPTIKQFNRSDLATESVQTITYEKNEYPDVQLTLRI